ncbi:MAG: response regulator [Elusimicrobia bacterium]|nr:response regulator [Elusimicrobiota bacterium]
MKKILVVDDDPEVRQLLEDLLRPDFDVRTAEDGVAGLAAAKAERPDLVILDLLMPRMHGYEVIQRIRQDEGLRDLKVLICSSKSYAADQTTARQAGADDYITKPYDVGALLGKIQDLVGEAKSPVSLRFWGTRGSIPTPGPRTERYGGNTPCVELRVGGRLLIIDAGSGIRELGRALLKEFQAKPISADLFISHTHWDHIQGLPFFTPIYLPQNRFTIHGVHGTTQGFADVLRGQMSHQYFPVDMKAMGSNPSIVELDGPVQLGEAKVYYHYLNHPGIAVGFRVETPAATVCYLSDHEPYGRLNAKGEFSAKEDDAVAGFVRGASLLICEAQYTDEEYKTKRSWGHSTFADVIGLAAKAEVKQLALFHHDPEHTDEMMDGFVAGCQELIRSRGYRLDCFGAQEGMALHF